MGDQIQIILMDYSTLRWWMEADGLVIDEPAAEMGPLNPFNSFAGDSRSNGVLARNRYNSREAVLKKEILDYMVSCDPDVVLSIFE
jgi:hypothetical protein